MMTTPKAVRDYKAQQQKLWRDRKRAAGLVDVTVWIPADAKQRLADYAAKIRREYEIHPVDE